MVIVNDNGSDQGRVTYLVVVVTLSDDSGGSEMLVIPKTDLRLLKPSPAFEGGSESYVGSGPFLAGRLAAHL